MGTLKKPRTIYLELPWPPSVNHYWRTVNGRPITSKRGRQYRVDVAAIMLIGRVMPIDGRLDVTMECYPPDKRKRDLDNLPKALLDALQHGGAFDDDGAIDRLEIVRCDVCTGGKVRVKIAGAEMTRRSEAINESQRCSCADDSAEKEGLA